MLADTGKKQQGKRRRRREVISLCCPVFFVGFMGAGKTSVVRYLARWFDIASIDLDTYLERREGKKISEIFADVGEEEFRKIESDVLREVVAKGEALLISCGGGIVINEQNRTILRESGFVVFLRANADEAARRIKNTATRPLFQDIETARKRYEEREPMYESVADVVVDTADRNVPEIAQEVRRLLERKGILCRQQRWL